MQNADSNLPETGKIKQGNISLVENMNDDKGVLFSDRKETAGL